MDMNSANSAPEGIMALQDPSAMDQGPRITPDQAFDGVNVALEKTSPEASQIFQKVMASLLPQLANLTDEQLDILIQFAQYLHENPQEYPQIVAKLISKGVIKEGDFPAEYNPEFVTALAYVAMTAKRQRGSQSPAPMEAPVELARGGIADAARIVASKGRSGDTMLAHITPAEARMLRARGGAGTINPATGLPEYGFILDEIFDFAGDVLSGVGKAVQGVLQSPIGQILGSMALAAFGIPMPFASAGATLLAGGSLQDAFVSGVSSFLGQATGPVSKVVGNLGIGNIPLNQAVSSGLIGTGIGLLRGQKLEDAIKGGLLQGAMAGGQAYITGPSSAEAAKRIADAQKQAGRVLTTDEATRAAMGEPFEAPLTDLSTSTAPVTPTGAQTIVPTATPDLDIYGLREGYLDRAAAPATSSAGAAAPAGSPAVTPPYTPTTPMGQLEKMGAAIKGGKWGELYEQGKELLFPAGPTEAQTKAMMESYKGEYMAGLKPEYRGTPEALSNAIKYAEDQIAKRLPGTMRTYGPLTAAGIATLGAAGGFKEGEVAAPGLITKTGMDLIKEDPRRYLVQNMYGVRYTPEGAFDPYPNRYAPPPRLAAKGGIMDIRRYAEGGDVENQEETLDVAAKPFWSDQQLAAAKDYFATVTDPQQMYIMAEKLGLSSDQLADLYVQSTGADTTLEDVTQGINQFLTGTGQKFTSNFINFTPEQQNAYLQYLNTTKRAINPEGELYKFYSQNKLTPQQAAYLSSQATGKDYFDVYDDITQRYGEGSGMPLGTGYTGGEDNFAIPKFRLVPEGSTTGTAAALPMQDYSQYYGGKNLIKYPSFTTDETASTTTPVTTTPVETTPVTTTPVTTTPVTTTPVYTAPAEYEAYRKAMLGVEASRPKPPKPIYTLPEQEPKVSTAEAALSSSSGLALRAGGIAQLSGGGSRYPRRIGQISGPGTETSDSIPAMLSDGEFVMTAKAVRGAGNGSRRDGAKKMYALMHRLENNAGRG